jgi:hypothetical protein
VAISTERIVDVGSIERLAESFEVSLRARNLSDRTIETYREAVRLFTAFLRSAGMPTEVSWVTFLRFPLTAEQAERLTAGDGWSEVQARNPLEVTIGPAVCERCGEDYDSAPWGCSGDVV